MPYSLPSGHTVIVSQHGASIGFETRNSDGETISTVYLPRNEGEPLVRDLELHSV
jgi:hypothetical protein